MKPGFFTITGIMLFLACNAQINAQEKIATYPMTAVDAGKDTFGIWLNPDQTLWIDTYSAYNSEVRCGMILDKHNLDNFITTLRNAKELYTEWKKIAIENDLKDIQQKMHFVYFAGGYFSYFDEIKQDDDVRLIFAFARYKDDYVLILNLEEMSVPGNDMIAFNGASIVFNSELEIDRFLGKISPDSIRPLNASTVEK